MAYRRYCFTINNPTLTGDQTLAEFEELTNFRFVIFQLEKAPTTGTLHFQGYVEFKNNKRYTAINAKMTDNGSYRYAAGNRQQNVAYCSKEDTREEGPWTSGTDPTPGQRNDLHDFAAFCMTAKSLKSVIEHNPSLFLRYSRGAQTILKECTPTTRPSPPVVVLLYGAPGTGKTRLVYDNFEHKDIYRKVTNDAFFDGYTGQDVFLIDDFAGRASKMSLNYFLALTDRYPVPIPVKQSTVPTLLATKIYITTNVHPREWYDYTNRNGEWRCVARRFNQIIYFNESGSARHVTKKSFFEDWYPFCDEEVTFKNFLTLDPDDLPGNQEAVDMTTPISDLFQ